MVKLTNKEAATLAVRAACELQGAASGLGHGRYATARKKIAEARHIVEGLFEFAYPEEHGHDWRLVEVMANVSTYRCECGASKSVETRYAGSKTITIIEPPQSEEALAGR